MSIASSRTSLYQALPSLLLKPLMLAPFPLQREVVSRLLQRLLGSNLMPDDIAHLRGKCIELRVTNLKLSRFFRLDSRQRIVMSEQGAPDVTIQGELNAFILLASRKEDPDTLFFRRRLVIEGDTELGLVVKNLLDRLELSTLPVELQFLLRSAGEFVELVG